MARHTVGISAENQQSVVMMIAADAPLRMLFTEFVQNGIEHNATEVQIDREEHGGVDKLVIRNNGDGMSPDEMQRRLTDLFSSSKVTSIDRNRGIGARAVAFKASGRGVIYRSCFEGRVFELLMERKDGRAEWEDIVERTPDYSPERRIGGWVEAVLLGESEDHDTYRNPYDGAKHGERQAAFDILRSIWRLPENFRVTIVGGGHQTKAGKERALRSTEIWTADRAIAKEFDVATKVKVSESVTITYLDLLSCDAQDGRGIRFRSAGVLGSVAVPTGVIYKNRIFDLHENVTKWKQLAMKVGLDLVSDSVMVVVELSDETPVAPDLMRGGLKWQQSQSDYGKSISEKVEVEDFAELIEGNQPPWLTKRIAAARKRFSSSSSAGQKFRDLMAEYKVLTDQLVPGGNETGGDKTEFDGGNGRTDTPVKTRKKTLEEGDKTSAKRKQLPKVMPHCNFIYQRESRYDQYFGDGAGKKPIRIIASRTQGGRDSIHVNMEHPLFRAALNSALAPYPKSDPSPIEQAVHAVLESEVIAVYAAAFYITAHESGIMNDERRFSDVASDPDSHLGASSIYLEKSRDVDKLIEKRLKLIGLEERAA